MNSDIRPFKKLGPDFFTAKLGYHDKPSKLDIRDLSRGVSRRRRHCHDACFSGDSGNHHDDAPFRNVLGMEKKEQREENGKEVKQTD